MYIYKLFVRNTFIRRSLIKKFRYKTIYVLRLSPNGEVYYTVLTQGVEEEHRFLVAPVQKFLSCVLHQQSVTVVDRVAQLKRKYCISL